jgi:carbon storage regulator
MLVLGRKVGESVTINGNVVVTVKKHSSKIFLAIDAPRDVPIVRTELLAKDRPEKESYIQKTLRESCNSQEFPSEEWLQSLGFVITESEHAIFATILLDDFSGEFTPARIELRLMLSDVQTDEWITDVVSVEESENTSSIGLVNSWCKTKEDVIRLGKALGLKAWWTEDPE